jgi:hypothetical protein
MSEDEKNGCFADMDDSELNEQREDHVEREAHDKLILEEFADDTDDANEPLSEDGEDPEDCSSEADLTGFEADGSRITDDPNKDQAEGEAEDGSIELRQAHAPHPNKPMDGTAEPFGP